MKIELLQSREELERELATADAGQLVGHQLYYMGAIGTLEHFLDHGATEEHARKMLGELRQNLEVVQAIARTKFPAALFTLDD